VAPMAQPYSYRLHWVPCLPLHARSESLLLAFKCWQKKSAGDIKAYCHFGGQIKKKLFMVNSGRWVFQAKNILMRNKKLNL